MRVRAIRWCVLEIGMRARRGIAWEQITQIEINRILSKEHRDDASECVLRLASESGWRTRLGGFGMLGV